jgi:hypothetical protein
MSPSADLSSLNRFVDVVGLSGAVYRFQRIDDAEVLPARAGNFLIAQPSHDGDQVVCCGQALRLGEAASVWRAALADHRGAILFVRLNVSRATRVGEHEDIVARHRPALVVTEFDLN